MIKKLHLLILVAAMAISSAFAAQNFKFANFGGSFESAKKAGYEGVQLDHYKRGTQDDKNGYSRKEIDDMKSKMKELDMQVCSICVPCYHKFLFEEDKNCVEYMKNIIDNAAELGAENILIPFFGKSSLYEKVYNRLEALVEILRLLGFVEELGVCFQVDLGYAVFAELFYGDVWLVSGPHYIERVEVYFDVRFAYHIQQLDVVLRCDCVFKREHYILFSRVLRNFF